MMKHIFSLIFLVSVMGAKAQAPELVFCEPSFESLNPFDMAIDKGGNIYKVGFSSDRTDYKPGPDSAFLPFTNNLTPDYGYVSSFDSSGHFRWVIGLETMSSGASSRISAITTDDSANFYITGYILAGTIDFDPDPAGTFTLSGMMNAGFIAKYDSTGNFKWVYQINIGMDPPLMGFCNLLPHDIAFDGNGVVVTGGLYGTIDFDPGPATNTYTTSGSESFVMKVTRNGQYTWAYGLDIVSDYWQDRVISNGQGDTYLSGAFGGTNIDFNPDPSATFLLSAVPGTSDVFVTKINSLLMPGDPGFFHWGFKLGGNDYDGGLSLALSDEKIYAAFNFRGSLDLDPSTGTHIISIGANMNLALVSYDLDYLPSQPQFFRWGFHFGSPGDEDEVSVITADGDGNVYVGGNISDDNVDFDPSAGVALQTCTYVQEPFLASYDAMGNYRWARIMTAHGLRRIVNINYSYDALYMQMRGASPGGQYMNLDLTGDTLNFNAYVYLVKYGSNCTGAETPLLASPSVYVCQGETATVNVSGVLNDAVYWNWYMNGCDSLVWQGNSFTFTPSDTVSLCIKGSGHCTSSDSTASVVVNVAPLPLIDFIGLPAVICEGNDVPVNLTPSQSGGVFSGSTGLSGNQFTAANAPVGINNITYTFTNALGCTNEIAHSILVNPLPLVDLLSYTDTLCINSLPTSFNASPMGGSFTGTTFSSGTYAELDPAITGTGDFTISYAYTSPSTGCTNHDSVKLTVTVPPTVTLTSAMYDFCVDWLGSTVLSVSPPGGNFYGASVGLGNHFYPSHNGVGTYYLQYIYTAYGCTNRDTVILNVYPSPVASISSPVDSVCKPGTSFPLTVSPPGGHYTGAIISAGDIFNPMSNSVGVHHVQYIYDELFGCESRDTVTIVVENCISVEEMEAVQAAKVYPNPFNDLLNIEMQHSGTYQVMLVNALGETVYTQNFNGTKTQLNTAALSTGVYLYRVSGNGISATGTLIRE